MKTTTLLLTLTLLLGACALSPNQQQKVDVGNVNSTIVGTINPANLGQ